MSAQKELLRGTLTDWIKHEGLAVWMAPLATTVALTDIEISLSSIAKSLELICDVMYMQYAATHSDE